MKKLSLIRLLVVPAILSPALLCVDASSKLFAESGPASAPIGVSEARRQATDLEIVDGQIIDKNSKPEKRAATLANVVDELRAHYPEANFVFSPALGKLNISDLKLHSGNVWEELEAIRIASGGKFEWVGPTGVVFGRPGSPSPGEAARAPATIDPTTGLPLAPAPGRAENRGLFILREASPTPENQRSIEAFNIGPYLETILDRSEVEQSGGSSPAKGPASQALSKEERNRRVQEALSQLQNIIWESIEALHPGQPAAFPTFQFHPGAKLLVVVGSREAVEAARKVVNALPGQTHLTRYEPETLRTGAASEEDAAKAMQDAFRRRYGLETRPNPAGSKP